jgi:hypothetical protein
MKAELFKGEGHTTTVPFLTSFGNYVFSSSVDGTIKKSERQGDSSIYEFKASIKPEGFP